MVEKLEKELNQQLDHIKKYQYELAKEIVEKKRQSFQKLKDLERQLEVEERLLEQEEMECQKPKLVRTKVMLKVKEVIT